ncbi:hypothetical protein QYE76_000062 [Lolium multiflorum]|uniref:Arabidopsis retrotransposon Orf1 C-terminal domain-containing protein n=1 Tax=Lolium multiflorum TaxID=4521 RepID=A0AAD8V7L6_LOLMU|nr:hypothetical protein QYE76_000062 [Lolium multiflorum]
MLSTHEQVPLKGVSRQSPSARLEGEKDPLRDGRFRSLQVGGDHPLLFPARRVLNPDWWAWEVGVRASRTLGKPEPNPIEDLKMMRIERKGEALEELDYSNAPTLEYSVEDLINMVTVRHPGVDEGLRNFSGHRYSQNRPYRIRSLEKQKLEVSPKTSGSFATIGTGTPDRTMRSYHFDDETPIFGKITGSFATIGTGGLDRTVRPYLFDDETPNFSKETEVLATIGTWGYNRTIRPYHVNRLRPKAAAPRTGGMRLYRAPVPCVGQHNQAGRGSHSRAVAAQTALLVEDSPTSLGIEFKDRRHLNRFNRLKDRGIKSTKWACPHIPNQLGPRDDFNTLCNKVGLLDFSLQEVATYRRLTLEFLSSTLHHTVGRYHNSEENPPGVDRRYFLLMDSDYDLTLDEWCNHFVFENNTTANRYACFTLNP